MPSWGVGKIYVMEYRGREVLLSSPPPLHETQLLICPVVGKATPLPSSIYMGHPLPSIDCIFLLVSVWFGCFLEHNRRRTAGKVTEKMRRRNV